MKAGANFSIVSSEVLIYCFFTVILGQIVPFSDFYLLHGFEWLINYFQSNLII